MARGATAGAPLVRGAPRMFGAGEETPDLIRFTEMNHGHTCTSRDVRALAPQALPPKPDLDGYKRGRVLL